MTTDQQIQQQLMQTMEKLTINNEKLRSTNLEKHEEAFTLIGQHYWYDGSPKFCKH